jgi:hypothetical protein
MGSGKNSASALANAMRGLATRMTVFFVEAALAPAMMAVAALFSAAAKYSSVSANVRSPGRAASALANPVSGAVASPKTSPARRLAISAVVKVMLILLYHKRRRRQFNSQFARGKKSRT